VAVVKVRSHEILGDTKFLRKGFFFLILVQVLSLQVLSLKHGKSLFRWEVQVHPHSLLLDSLLSAVLFSAGGAGETRCGGNI
jgi:hypothetical protein